MWWRRPGSEGEPALGPMRRRHGEYHLVTTASQSSCTQCRQHRSMLGSLYPLIPDSQPRDITGSQPRGIPASLHLVITVIQVRGCEAGHRVSAGSNGTGTPAGASCGVGGGWRLACVFCVLMRLFLLSRFAGVSLFLLVWVFCLVVWLVEKRANALHPCASRGPCPPGYFTPGTACENGNSICE